jgi:hypothetical protein
MNTELLEDVNFYANAVFLSLTVLASLALLIVFRFRLEKSAYFVIFSYIFTIGPRLLMRGNAGLYSGLEVIFPICSTVTWGTLLFFTFEMAFVKAMLESESQKDYLNKKIRLRKIMIGLFVIHFAIYMPLNIFIFLKAADISYDNPEHMWPTVIPRAITHSIVCGYGFYMFVVCF